MIGYWFTRPDPDGVVRLFHGDGRVVRVGETLKVEGPIIPSCWGLHAARRIRDSLDYAPGPWLGVVRLSGTIVEASDIMAASAREILWLSDVSDVLWRYVCDIAARALRVEEALGRAVDARSWAAITTTRRWLDGDATVKERHHAYQEARTAAMHTERPAGRPLFQDDVWRRYQASLRTAWAAAESCHPPAHSAAAKASHLLIEATAWRALTQGDSEYTRIGLEKVEEAWQEAYLLDLLHEAGMPFVEEGESDGIG